MKKSLISAIKKLLAKLGAEEIEGNNLVEVIDSGADAIEGGGGSGSNSPFIFTITMTSQGKDVPTYSCDKTHTEIFNAAQNNAVICRLVDIHDGAYQGGELCGNVDARYRYVKVTTHNDQDVGLYTIVENTVTYTLLN